MLDDPELSETAKREFLQTLWNCILELIDIGVEVHATSSLDQSCGKPAEAVGEAAIGLKSAVHCKDRST